VTSAPFLLAMGPIFGVAAWSTALALLALLPWARGRSAAARREIAAWAAVAPALVGALTVAGTAAPSLAAALRLGADHCLDHAHHAHLCWTHGAVMPGWSAAIGAAAWGLVLGRSAVVAARLARVERAGARLAALGRDEGDVRLVPASAPVCHVVGVSRPTIVLSEAVRDGLAPDELRAVLAHERAHLGRHDSRWSAVIELATAPVPMAAPWVALWREAAEDVADDCAASETDGPTVASALIAVARMRPATAPGLAFGGAALEGRVRRLLRGGEPPRPCRALTGAAALVVLGLVGVGLQHERLHHVIEEAWGAVVGA
jgi:Zn-dependent protease with chaperone function